MSFPTCKATGLPIAGWGNHQQVVVHYLADRVEVNHDGTSARYVEDAGVFCSDACLAAYLEPWAPDHGDARPPREVLRQRGLPCVRAKDPEAWGDADPF